MVQQAGPPAEVMLMVKEQDEPPADMVVVGEQAEPPADVVVVLLLKVFAAMGLENVQAPQQ